VIPGRKPKSREQRLREGKAAHRPLPEPVLVSGRPELAELASPPPHLEPEAREFWERSVVRLAEAGIVDRVDAPVLELLATQYARIRQAQATIEAEGMYVEGSRGQPRPHPAIAIEREATRVFLGLADHFALTPVARTRLGLAELHRRRLVDDLDEAFGPVELKPA
jgi:P27 family predicted phage terminase small subunit